MNYSNRTVARPLSICDARYKPCLLRRQKNYRMVIIRHLDPTRCMRKKSEPARLARGGFRSPLALPATDFLVRRAHDAPLFSNCHLAPQQQIKSLIYKVYLNIN